MLLVRSTRRQITSLLTFCGMALLLLLGEANLGAQEEAEPDIEQGSAEDWADYIAALAIRKPKPKFVVENSFQTPPRYAGMITVSDNAERMVMRAKDDSGLLTYDLTTGKHLATIVPQNYPAQGFMAMSDDGEFVVYTSNMEILEVFETDTGDSVCLLDQWEEPLTWVHISPDARRLAISDDSGQTWSANIDGSDLVQVHKADRKNKGVVQFLMADESRWLKVDFNDTHVRIRWNIGDEIMTETMELFSFPRANIGGNRFLVLNGGNTWLGSFDRRGLTKLESVLLPNQARWSNDGKRVWRALQMGVDFTQEGQPDMRLTVPLLILHETNSIGICTPDVRKVVCHSEEGQATVFRLEGDEVSQAYRVVTAVHRLLEAERLDALDALAKKWEADTLSWADRLDQTAYAMLLTTLVQWRKETETIYERVERAERLVAAKPESPLLRLFLQRLYLDASEDAKFRQGDLMRFDQYVAKGWDVIQPLLEAPNVVPEAYAAALINLRFSKAPREKLESYMERALEDCPDYPRIWSEVLLTNRPKFGAEPGYAEAWTAKAADKVGGKQGDGMYAEVTRATRNRISWQDTFDENDCGYDAERVLRGLIYRLENCPDDFLANHTLQVAKYVGNRAEARHAMQLFKQYDTVYMPGVWWGYDSNEFFDFRQWASAEGDDD